MKQHEAKLRWFSFNIIFLFTYTLTIIPYIINIPIRPPRLVVCLPLFISYYFTLKKKDLSSILKTSNLYCMALFLTLPHHLLLLPFYIISYFNVSSYVATNKKHFLKYKFCSVMCQSIEYKKIACLIAYTLEVCLAAFCALLYLFGYVNIFTFSTYVACVYAEYLNNEMMRMAANNALEFCITNFGKSEIISNCLEVMKNTYSNYMKPKSAIKKESKRIKSD